MKLKRMMCVVFACAFVLPVWAAAEDWHNAALVDNHCVANVKSNPDAHTRDCMLQCQRQGYGIVTDTGEYLKLDAGGNAQAFKLLQQSKQKDHLRVEVTGERQGDTIKVQSIKM
jgi:hypothetical protein